MHEPFAHAALLSNAQLEAFRSLLEMNTEAAFLAPQLLEQVAILTRDLRHALEEIDRLREGMGRIERAATDMLGASDDEAVRAQVGDLLATVLALRSA